MVSNGMMSIADQMVTPIVCLMPFNLRVTKSGAWASS